MKTATHISKCGKWLYKVQREVAGKRLGIEYKADVVYFWDSYCSKWRESCMSKRNLVKLNKA